MDHLNGGYMSLAITGFLFMGLQVLWISMVLRGQKNQKRQRYARPMSTAEFKRSLERIWEDSPVAGPHD
ncbi:MAG TPA: hypothetical protein QF626_08180 [Prochlorococcaceae cyanobacterium Fu_MAG_50]|nr:hypothetical protein [Prochlorococcaceae cyanobacterium Fu_MAG_50]